jgi:hypothetical protein
MRKSQRNARKSKVMIRNTPYKYLLGALSAILLSVPGISGAAVPSANTAVYSDNIAEAVGKISQGYFDQVKDEVSKYLISAKGIDGNASLTAQQKQAAIIMAATAVVQKFPEAVPELLAKTKVSLTNYYEPVKVAVIKMDSATLTSPQLIKDEASALKQEHRGNAVAATADASKGASGHAKNQDWLNYKVNMGSKTVIWRTAQWNGGGSWVPKNIAASSKDAMRLAVFANKWLTYTPLSQSASLFGGQWTSSIPTWAQDPRSNVWSSIMTKEADSSLNKTLATFLGKDRRWFEKVNLAMNNGPVVVAQNNPPVINDIVSQVIDKAVTSQTPKDIVDDPHNVSPSH